MQWPLEKFQQPHMNVNKFGFIEYCGLLAKAIIAYTASLYFVIPKISPYESAPACIGLQNIFQHDTDFSTYAFFLASRFLD